MRDPHEITKTHAQLIEHVDLDVDMVLDA